MTSTNTGFNIRQLLLSGSIASSSALTTLLSDANTKASFNAMINDYNNAKMLFENSTVFGIIFNSTTAWNIVKTCENAIDAITESMVATKTAVSTSAIIQSILADSNFDNSFRKTKFKTLKQHINRSYSKLKRQIFLTSANFTPANNVAKVCYLLIGAGGGGGSSATFSFPNGGGGGGEIVSGFFTSLTASTNYAITIGAGGAERTNGGNTTFTDNSTTAIAHGGEQGRRANDDGGTYYGTGGGSTTNSGLISLSDLDFENAVWQVESMTQKGCKGAYPSGNKAEYFKELGGYLVNDGTGKAGTGISGGGDLYSSTSALTGDSASDNSGCGGGAASSNTSGHGGTGGSGKAILYYIEA